jgi:hypothetical protein
MKLRTDDDIYRARLVWLGPPRYTLPIQLPYAQWVCGAVVFVVFAVLSWLLTGGAWSGIGIALGATLPATSLIFKFVDHDRPARKILRTVATDWQRTGAPAAGPEPQLTATKVQVTR